MPRSGRQPLRPFGSARPTADDLRLVRPSEVLTLYGDEASARERHRVIGPLLPARHPFHWVGGDLSARRAFWDAWTPRYRALHLGDRP